jgi:hypothetical protein
MSEHHLKDLARILPITLPTCGTCAFAQKFTQGAADCFGMPPSVHMIGAGRDALNRPAIQLETFVPRVAADRPACSLHRPRLSFETDGRA